MRRSLFLFLTSIGISNPEVWCGIRLLGLEERVALRWLSKMDIRSNKSQTNARRLVEEIVVIPLLCRPNRARLSFMLFIIAEFTVTRECHRKIHIAKTNRLTLSRCLYSTNCSIQLIGMKFVTAIQDYSGTNLPKLMIDIWCRMPSGDEVRVQRLL